MPLRRSSGNRPALSSEVLPSPDLPNSTVSGACNNSRLSSEISRWRPLKNAAALSPNHASPGQGLSASSVAGFVAESSAMRRLPSEGAQLTHDGALEPRRQATPRGKSEIDIAEQAARPDVATHVRLRVRVDEHRHDEGSPV